jgi:hypothetical protein
MKTLEWKTLYPNSSLVTSTFRKGLAVLLLTVWKVAVKSGSSGNMMVKQNISWLFQRRRQVHSAFPILKLPFVSSAEQRLAYVKHFIIVLFLSLWCHGKVPWSGCGNEPHEAVPCTRQCGSVKLRKGSNGCSQEQKVFLFCHLSFFQLSNFSGFFSLDNVRRVGNFFFPTNSALKQAHTL